MDKEPRYIRTLYTVTLIIIVLYIVRGNLVLPSHIVKYKVFLSVEQKIEGLVLEIFVFFVLFIFYFIVDEKSNTENLENCWALELLRKLIWMNEVEPVFKEGGTYQNKRANKNISNLIALSIMNLFAILYIKPEWTLFLIYLSVIVAGVCIICPKNKRLCFPECISAGNIGYKRKILSTLCESIVIVCNIMSFVFTIKQFTDVSFSNLALIYYVSSVFSQISLIQDGLVVPGLIQIHLLSKLIEPRAVITTILMYRMVSSVIPWIILLIITLRRIYDNYNINSHKKQFTFNILSIFILIVGIIPCSSVATPSILLGIKLLRRFVKKDVLVLVRFITLILGGLLVLLSQGIKKSVKKSFYITETVLIISVFSTLLKGLDIEESIITLILGIVMYIMKDGFTEKAIKFSTKYFTDTIIKLSAVTAFFAFISNSVRKVNFFSSCRRHSLQYLIENKKFTLLYVLLVLILSYLAQYTRTKKITSSKSTDEDFSKIGKFLDECGRNEFSHLVYLNDKDMYFDRTNTVMIMYRLVQNSTIISEDPIGKKENFVEAISDFIVYHNEYHINVCFYEINGESLELYRDQGF